MAEQPKHLINEEDIGSGEKGAGQADTQKQIEQVPVQNVTGNSQQENRQGQGASAGNMQRQREPAPPTPHKSGKELADDLSQSLVDTTATGVPPKGN